MRKSTQRHMLHVDTQTPSSSVTTQLDLLLYVSVHTARAHGPCSRAEHRWCSFRRVIWLLTPCFKLLSFFNLGVFRVEQLHTRTAGLGESDHSPLESRRPWSDPPTSNIIMTHQLQKVRRCWPLLRPLPQLRRLDASLTRPGTEWYIHHISWHSRVARAY